MVAQVFQTVSLYVVVTIKPVDVAHVRVYVNPVHVRPVTLFVHTILPVTKCASTGLSVKVIFFAATPVDVLALMVPIGFV